jgi:hypothetical protein
MRDTERACCSVDVEAKDLAEGELLQILVSAMERSEKESID